MVAPKKSRPKAPTAHEFTVILEDLRAQFAVFGEALESVRDSLREEMRRGFERVDRRFEQVDQRFEALERDMGLVKSAVTEQSRELASKVTRDEVETMVKRAAGGS
jgi:archaellum component FlaC